jgi:peptidoglycan hydrolase-like protein with peptidoglycan-binding domain
MILDLGDKGPQVVELQTKLGVEATGTFDNTTRIAVIGLQLNNGLPAHGAATEVEWDLLGCKLTEAKPAFKPNAKDGDKDGKVQDSTPYERPTEQTDDKCN